VISSKNGAILKFLLEHGADPNAVMQRSSWLIGDLTPLIAAAWHELPTEVEALFAHGAVIENRAMHFTLRQPNPHRLAIMSILLDHGADINAYETALRNPNGGPLPRWRYTPVAEAVVRNDVEAVKFLVQRSANLLLKAEHVYERDEIGESALELMRLSKNEKIRELIPEEYKEGGENV
jgi:ankyrin repeat protein